MPLYNFISDSGQIKEVAATTFKEAKLKERSDLQRLLRDHIEVLDKDLMILAEEFGDWEDSGRRIDLLALDRDANLVVIELKRDDSAHMELQAIRYAAMISAMKFEVAVAAHEKYLTQLGRYEQAEAAADQILDFLGWEAPIESEFGQRVRIVLASSTFSKELTTTALWLRDKCGLDLRCFRMVPYLFGEAVLVDVQQIIPLPEASEFLTKLREKTALVVAEKTSSNRDLTKFNVEVGGEPRSNLPKRQALFEIVAHLYRTGVSPDEITQHCEKYPWLVLDGDLDAKTFKSEALAKFEQEGYDRDRIRRYFLDEGQLFVSAGKTYALTRMWGGERFVKTLENLKKAYPARFDYWPAE